MVIVELRGGLGNQMFQYAFGRQLALLRKEEMFLYLGNLADSDGTSPTQDQPIRKYGLDLFNIQSEVGSLPQLRERGIDFIWTLTETGFGYFREASQEARHHRDIGLMGWWQSENYFLEAAGNIRQELAFRPDYATPHSPSLIEEIMLAESICVHVRRTDYLLETDLVGFIGLQYYQRALDFLANKFPRPHVFVFSDDIGWCQEHLLFRFPTTFVVPTLGTAGHAAHDLYAMMLCKHFIIANSTYSWWAAWLAPHQQKIVVAPQLWFRAERNTATPDISSKHIIPPGWITL